MQGAREASANHLQYWHLVIGAWIEDEDEDL
jgi:hypothetical protein